jgi:lysophospholipase L1-like esterase
MTFLTWVFLAMLVLGQPATTDPQLPQAEESVTLGARSAPDAEDLRGKTYVALGDSISAGKYAVSPDKTFPVLVSEQLGMPLGLIARSGARAAWALPNLRNVTAAQPSLVTVELGTNDAGFYTAPEEFAQQYETIMTAVSRQGTKVLCIGSWLPAPDFDSMISRICQRHGGTYVSLNGYYLVDAFHASDGLGTFLGPGDWFHPGDQGHAAIAAAVLAALAGPAPTHQVVPMTGEQVIVPLRPISS